jgi:hypothetical protein
MLSLFWLACDCASWQILIIKHLKYHKIEHSESILMIKLTRCTTFSNLFLEWNSTCFIPKINLRNFYKNCIGFLLKSRNPTEEEELKTHPFLKIIVLNFITRPFYSWQPLNRSVDGPKSKPGNTVKEKKSLALTVVRALDTHDCTLDAIPNTLLLIMTTKYILNTPPRKACFFEGFF